MNYFKTFLLMLGLMTLALGVGHAMAGQQGMVTAFLFAGGMNFFLYFFSDKMVLASHHAKPVDASSAPELHAMVSRLARKAGMPVPRLYVVQDSSPNAFATGRSPSRAAVAVTTGLLETLPPRELEAVLAHELTHVRNRDVLIMTVAATFAGVIMMLTNWVFVMFGGRDSNRNPLVTLAILIVAPLAATIVQLAISRSREYDADRGGAALTSREAMKDALRRIHQAVRARPSTTASEASAHLFIANPFGGRRGVSALFMTHPTLEQRLAALDRMA